MAKQTASKPATKPAKASEKAQPATEQPAANPGVGIKELAARLGRKPKSVRAQIRRINGGPVVGQGGRYRWESEQDPKFVAMLESLTPKQAEAEAAAS